MAEDTDDKTEDSTQKRLEDAHAKGDVAKSQEVNTERHARQPETSEDGNRRETPINTA
jgi:hypothetical protein